MPLDTDEQSGVDPGAPSGMNRGRDVRRARALMRGSALRRRIIFFNLTALNILILGVLYLGGGPEPLLRERGETLVQNVSLMADVIAGRLPDEMPVATVAGAWSGGSGILRYLNLRAGTEVMLFDRNGHLLLRRCGDAPPTTPQPVRASTPLSDGLDRIEDVLTGLFRGRADPDTRHDPVELVREMVGPALGDGPQMGRAGPTRDTVVWAAAPVVRNVAPVAVLALADATDTLDWLIAAERERVLRLFLIAALISVGLSLVLASAIARPLADLAKAAETGRNLVPSRRGATDMRIRIPDLTARPDEIGRLSEALRGMVAALYHRIESNEQFAADVTHEIKNPLTSLRCAVGALRRAERPDQRARLIEVIEHDVRRLDRLVSDISSASRLDSDLVKDEQAPFDLLAMLRNLGQYLETRANDKDVAFITDFPEKPIVITGLEARLAQVFVNLISNAISFCEAGDAIRVWARQRANRVLVVVEDTGPGIPADALEKVFDRFYSNRPDSEFGNNSGLGLAISKQIVEAHDGLIWAENIRPTEADVTSEPLGVRFVVGLSV